MEQSCAGQGVMCWQTGYLGEISLVYAPSNFCGVNAPTLANFKLPGALQNSCTVNEGLPQAGRSAYSTALRCGASGLA